MKSSARYPWFVVVVFFFFMLLHQADKLLIGPLTSDIIEDFDISLTQMGAVSTGALIVGAIFYPLWGYLFDRFTRAKLLALASFLWGSTTWLNALAPTFRAFLITRSSTGIDDSSYPGMYSLISDYFPPRVRGKVFGLLNLAGPLGYLLGMVLGLLLSGAVGWRGVFFITGSLGILISAIILFAIRDAPRGQSEPEMAGLHEIGVYRFDWGIAKNLFKIRSLILLFIQGFFGVFPWNAIVYFFFLYLETERGYDANTVLITMVVAVLVLAAGYPIGGALGDRLFKRTHRGRLIVSAIGVLSGAILLIITLNIPLQSKIPFLISLAVTALFIPFAAPNVIASVYDVTLPEVRSTAIAVQYFIESTGAALAPLIVGFIAEETSLKSAFLIICTSTWLLCALFFVFSARIIPRDIAALHHQLQQRAEHERVIQAGMDAEVR